MPLASKYSASDLRSVLKCMLQPQGSRQAVYVEQPFFYTGINPNIIALPPVTDTEQLGLELFSETLQQIFTYSRENQLNLQKKIILFPVVQGQTILGIPRNHFVTLHYDPSTRIATIIDSRPRLAGMFYPLEALKQSLREGLAHGGLGLDDVVVKYQATQWDDTHCGAWTANNIVALAHGITVEKQHIALIAQDGPRIVQHNIESVRDKTRVPYAPLEAIKANALTPKSSHEDLSSDYVDVGEVVGFNDEEQATYISTAQELFHQCFSSPKALANALIARENIIFNNKKLNLDDIETIANNLDEMFSDLEAEHPALGYRLFNKHYVTAKLIDVGFDEVSIQAMSLTDKLRYDAALCFAEANAGQDLAKACLFEGTEDMSETMFEDTVSAYRMFKVVLAAVLKQEVLQQQAADYTVTTTISTVGLASAALLPEFRKEESPVSIVHPPLLSSLEAGAGAGQMLPTKQNKKRSNPTVTPENLQRVAPVPVERSEHAQETPSYALSYQLMFGIALAGGVLLLAISLALANPFALSVGAAVTAVGGIGLMYGLFSSSDDHDDSSSVHAALKA